jgi:hypothetical protein
MSYSDLKGSISSEDPFDGMALAMTYLIGHLDFEKANIRDMLIVINRIKREATFPNERKSSLVRISDFIEELCGSLDMGSKTLREMKVHIEEEIDKL